LRVICSNNSPQPVGPYSQAIEVGGFIFVSGQLGLDAESGKMVEGGVERETEVAIRNLQSILEEAGISLKNVVRMDVFLRNIDNFAVMNGVYERFFSKHKPTRVVVGVNQLPKGAHIELSAIAVKSLDV